MSKLSAPERGLKPATTIIHSHLHRLRPAHSSFVILEVMAGQTGANDDTAQTWGYHNATKHSEQSLRANPHYLDWQNQPKPLKIYTTIDPIPLPRDADQSGIAALSAISTSPVEPDRETRPGMQDLARILYFSAGITKRKTYG